MKLDWRAMFVPRCPVCGVFLVMGASDHMAEKHPRWMKKLWKDHVYKNPPVPKEKP